VLAKYTFSNVLLRDIAFVDIDLIIGLARIPLQSHSRSEDSGEEPSELQMICEFLAMVFLNAI
jgi:hypothetical protein